MVSLVFGVRSRSFLPTKKPSLSATAFENGFGMTYRVRWSLGAPFFGARGVRVLQDFAAICRGNDWIFFVFRVRELTHNP
jgi:hypothetical protein